MLSRGARAISHLAVQDEPQLLERVEVERVAHDDLQRPVLLGHGQDAFSRATDSGTSSITIGRDDHFVQVDEVQAVLLGHGPHDLLAGAVAQPDQGVVDLHARRSGPCVPLPGAGRG